jgi:uncharacterized protein YdcH (DUF465 family)
MDNMAIENEKGMKLFEEELIKLKELVDLKEEELNAQQAKNRKLEADFQAEVNELKEERLKLKDEVRKMEQFQKLWDEVKEERDRLA